MRGRLSVAVVCSWGGCRALAAFAAAGEQSGDHNACDDE